MAPKKSTRVYALAAATVITAGTLSYVPATFASEAGSSTGSDTSATESTHENSSLPLQTIPWAKSSASAQPAGAQETASAASTQVPEQEKPVKSESPRPPLRLLQPQPLKLNHLKPLPFQNRPRKPQRLLPAQRLSGLRMRVMKPQRGARTLLRFLLIPPLSTPITNLALSPCVSVVSTVRALVAL